MNRAILFFIIAIIVSYNSGADDIGGVFKVGNVLPIVSLDLYGDAGFRNIRAGFQEGETGYLRIRVSDANGYQDIKEVSVRYIGIDNNAEDILADYSIAEFIGVNGDVAVYRYRFNVSKPGSYRLDVRVRDGEDEVISNIGFDRGNINQIRGAAVATTNRQVVVGFFRAIFRRLASLF